MKSYVYHSGFAKYIYGLIEQKCAVGYKYESKQGAFKRLDDFFCINAPNESNLTKELVDAWCVRRETESIPTQSMRITTVRQLGLYMASIGLDAYIAPDNICPRCPQFVPHIFSKEELNKIFKQSGLCNPVYMIPMKHLIIPVLFRVLYGCGLRISEALKLKLKDVDIESGVFTIKDAKFGKDRLVPLSQDLLIMCRDYCDKVHVFSTPDTSFFPDRNGKMLNKQTIYNNFRRFLLRSGISHGGKSKGPRLHDFRHTFAVYCLKNWVLEGKDLNAYLPVLKTYLGHSSLQDTSEYLRLTADLYPDITAKLDSTFQGVIPEMAGDLYEAD